MFADRGRLASGYFAVSAPKEDDLALAYASARSRILIINEHEANPACAQSLDVEAVIWIVHIKVGVGEALIDFEIEVGIFLQQFGIATLLSRPIIGFVANWHLQFVVEINARYIEQEISARHRMDHLNHRANSAADLGALIELHVAFAVLLVLFADFDQASGQIRNSQFRDRITLIVHGERAIG